MTTEPSEKRRREQEIMALPGFRVAREQAALGITYRLLAANARELVEALRAFDDPDVALPVLDLDNEAAFNAYIENVGRLLHNYLASVKTLVDHTRNLVRELWPERAGFVKREYEPRLQRLFAEPEPVFLQKLRDFALHYRRLPLINRITFTQEQRDSAFALDTDVLRRWGSWTAPAKQYLDEQGGSIALLPLVERYQFAVEQFYQWFGPAVVQEHLAELAEYDRAQTAYETWLRDISQ